MQYLTTLLAALSATTLLASQPASASLGSGLSPVHGHLRGARDVAAKRAQKKRMAEEETEAEREVEEKRSSSYKLIKSYNGSSFFDDMYFYTGSDPTNGMVTYVDKSTATSNGLIGTKNGHAYMTVAQSGSSGVHNSVRVSTQGTFTGGIFVLDAVHMPVGCGVWPAWWTTPEDPAGGWPNGGEIDIIEGVHYFSRNMMSVHTSSGCSVVESALEMLGELAMSDKTLATNCDPEATSDQGCGVQSQTSGDYGSMYNQNGGGIHVLDWDTSDGLSVYFFNRSSIPDDITSGSPDPSSWGTPRAQWPATKCNPDSFFWNHVAVFSNTLCGTWAGSSSVWDYAMSGQSFTCSAKTGSSSCYDYMTGSPDLSEAYWEIKSMKIYQTTRRE